MKTVLILGGSGYLGQFLVQDLGKEYKVGCVTQHLVTGHGVCMQQHLHVSGWLHPP